MNNLECPICLSKGDSQQLESNHVYGGKSDQSIYHCTNCDLYYLTPRPTQEELNRFYENDFESFMSKRSGVDSNWDDSNQHVEINIREFIRRKPYIDKHLYNGCKVLEVGASSGFMLTNIEKNNPGIQVSAVEPSLEFSNYLMSLNITHYKYLSDIDDSNKFDLIMHFFVMAHVENVKSFMQQCYDKLDGGGVMILETPSATDPLYALYDIDEYKAYYWQIAHIYSFTKKSMEYLLESMGWKYEIIAHQRYDLSNHMWWMQSGKPGGRGKYAEIFSTALDKQYKEDLAKSHYFDALIVTIRKP